MAAHTTWADSAKTDAFGRFPALKSRLAFNYPAGKVAELEPQVGVAAQLILDDRPLNVEATL